MTWLVRSHDHKHYKLVFGLAFIASLLVITSQLNGTQPSSIVRVEADWQVSFHAATTTSGKPRLTVAMSPVGSDEAEYMTFELNHVSQPTYAVGGLHLHVWNGEQLQGTVNTASTEIVGADTVSWTQSMTLSEGNIIYEISNGQSQTWGSFGIGDLKVTLPTGLANLDAYAVIPFFGASSVSALQLKNLRVYDVDGHAFEVNLASITVTIDETVNTYPDE